MRGHVTRQSALFYSINLESLVPADHPLRPIKKLADEELKRLGPKFNAAYSNTGRPSIPPQTLIKASLLQALYGVRSERQLCEQIRYNFLFRWFLDLAPDDVVFDHSSFSANRDRFADNGLMQAFFDGTVAHAIHSKAAGCEHFSVDGTLIQSFASMKSFKPRDDDEPYDGNAWADFKGEKRSNASHASKTDPEAKLYRKSGGQAALLYHSLHMVMDNRNDILMDMDMDDANGTAERSVALRLLDHLKRRHRVKVKTLGGDKGYDAQEFDEDLRVRGVTPHIAQRGQDGKRRSLAYRASQVARKAIEKINAWFKDTAGFRRSRYKKRYRTKLYALGVGAAYNLMRLTKILFGRQAALA